MSHDEEERRLKRKVDECDIEEKKLTLKERKLAFDEKMQSLQDLNFHEKDDLLNTVEEKQMLENIEHWMSLMDRLNPEWREDARLMQQAETLLTVRSASLIVQKNKLENIELWMSLMDRLNIFWRGDARLRQQAETKLDSDNLIQAVY
jgi:hypothetical protein